MNEPTLTDTEREALQEARGLRVPTGGMSSVLDRCEREVERIVAEAVDRERAAWVAKIETLADEWTRLAGKQAHPATRTLAEAADDLRGLLAADDTEEIHPSVQWVANIIAAAVSAEDAEGKP